MANFSSYKYKQAPKAVLEACNEIGVIKNPLKTDTDAQMLAKVICTAAMSGADVAFSEEADGSARVVLNGKTGIDPIDSALESDDICLYLRNSTASRFEFIQDINDKAIANAEGDTLNIPQSVHYIREPSAIVV